MESKDARKIYRESGITYDDISSKDIAQLISYIRLELELSKNDLEMKLCKLRKQDISYNESGGIDYCYLMVNGSYFKRREAISFNRRDKNGLEFIGFAGWAGGTNTEPFIKAFSSWIGHCS